MRVSIAALALLTAACGGAPDVAETSRPNVSDADVRVEVSRSRQLAEAIAERLFAHAQAHGDSSANMLRELTQLAPGRSAGSAEAEEAASWAERKMHAIGLAGVRREPVVAPCWERGEPEIARLIIQGTERPLAALAMTGSVPTRPGGIRAPILHVTSLAELEQKAAVAKGRFVFLDVRLRRGVVDAQDAYAEIRDVLEGGADFAARVGARGVIVRSPSRIDDDHVRVVRVRYSGEVERIPAVTVSPTTADALGVACHVDPNCALFLELSCSAKPVLRLTDNVVGEIRGATLPEEIVVLAARLDACWLGQGAHGGGADVANCLEAARQLLASGTKLDRTLRVVLFTDGVETGRGLQVYAADHSDELDLHVVTIAAVAGGFRPSGFDASQPRAGSELHIGDVRSFVSVLEPFGISRVQLGEPVQRFRSMLEYGIPVLQMRSSSAEFYDVSNSYLDRYESVDPRALGLGSSVLAYVAAAFANPEIYK
ncbi:MAG: M28 family peptidase [Planctomycetes bacterium]|nr:M28 family peptidase [Planctomycetota bacterium]